MTTMDEKYGDGSPHEVCEVCGMCRTCGDCNCFSCKMEEDEDICVICGEVDCDCE